MESQQRRSSRHASGYSEGKSRTRNTQEDSNNPSPHKEYRNIYGHGAFVWKIYPYTPVASNGSSVQDFGTVFADDEFYALREAFSKGILPADTLNVSLETYYVAVRIGKGKSREELRARSLKKNS